MRKIICILIIAALCFVPLKRVDIAKLRPIQAVAMYMEDQQIVLETDTGDQGRGKRVLDALQNLKEKTAAVVYLDTADFLLVAENAISHVGELAQNIKQSVKVCVCEAAGRVKEVAQYLEVHGNLPKLKDWLGEK